MPVSKKQQACVRRYMNKHYDRIEITVPKGSRDILKQAAALRGISTNAYITAALEKALAEDGLSLPGRFAEGELQEFPQNGKFPPSKTDLAEPPADT